MHSDAKIRVAIIGAGIGGLTLSVALGAMKRQKSSLEIDVYEASPRISEIGAGINFWPRTWSVMKSIGLEEELLRFLPQVPDDSSIAVIFEVRKADQQEGFYIEDLKRRGGPIRFHRADLQQTFINHLEGQLHLSHRLADYEEDGDEIRLQFENGRSATCDLLIGMDGINSVVRKCFLTRQGLSNSPSFNPVWSGHVAYRALIPVAKLEAQFPESRALYAPMMYWGKSKHIVTYPVSSGQSINAVFFTFDQSQEGLPYDGPNATSCTQEEIASMFRCWEKEVQALIRCTENPSKWAIRALMPMERYSKGRVILCGDATHAMTPFQGGGAAQAIEDAYILASLLSDELCKTGTLLRISEIYNSVRYPMGNSVLEKSKISGKTFELMVPGFEDVVEGDDNVPLEILKELVYEIQREWAWVSNTSPMEDKLRALEMLKEGPH